MIVTLPVSKTQACRVIGQHRSTQNYEPKRLPDEDALTARTIDLACKYGRYGYRRITALLNTEGYCVNHKRIERIWREQGLKVPQKQKKRRRLWLNDGSCIRLKPEHPNHVWSYDFVLDKTTDSKAFKILNIIDEYSRECLCTYAARHIRYPRYAGADPGRMYKNAWQRSFVLEVYQNTFGQIMVASLQQTCYENG